MVRDFIKNIGNNINYVKNNKIINIYNDFIYELDYYKDNTENEKLEKWYLNYDMYNLNKLYLATGDIEINYDEVKFLASKIYESSLNQNNIFIEIFSNYQNNNLD